MASWIVVAALLASASSTRMQVHETASAPSNWQDAGPANPATYVRLSVTLAQPGLGELKKRLLEVSDLDHPEFGAHLSKDQLQEYRKPDDNAAKSIVGWLTESGAQDVKLEADAYIRFTSNVSTINSLLDCDLRHYTSPEGRPAFRATQYSLPSELTTHIRFVYPVTQFIEIQPSKYSIDNDEGGLSSAKSKRGVLERQSSAPASCSQYVSPECLRDLYNINYTAPDALSGSTLGIAGFLEEYPGQSALHAFLAAYGLHPNDTGAYAPDAYNFSAVSINGGNTNDEGSGGEATLDTFYSMAFTQPLPVTYLSTGGRGQYIGANGTDMSNTAGNFHEPWLEFAEGLLAMDDANLPKVLSLSYTDDEQSTPRAYALHVCDLFAQLAARGVSILAAAGDSGASGTDRGDCKPISSNLNGENWGNQTQRFLASFPVSCPYVTAVGALELHAPEPTSWSGGGFSEYFDAPDWQRNDTIRYVQGLNGSHAGWFNETGRGFPDVTVVGVRYVLQAPFTTKGTSASTPVVAAMVTLLNDARLRKGRPVLGFLNPLLYKDEVRAAFTNVTNGNIEGCLKPDGTPELGFAAAEGWDAASGLGAPDFGELFELLT